MIHFTEHPWEIAAGVAVTALVCAVALWLVFRKRPTPEELERARRLFLAQSGRLVDGMLLDIYEIEAPVQAPLKPNAESSRPLTMLLYRYQFGGVDY
jgi:hypothetical protein